MVPKDLAPLVFSSGWASGSSGWASGVTALAVAHPWLALGVSATLLIVGVILVICLLGTVRRGLAAMRRRRSRTP